ncbi:MAG: phage terminase small subunit P27 family [Candidatus Dormiibacter spiritus]|nr:MAG: phage terminase small subunit P27 family [Candidatus Dormibacteraeota bacterium]
MPSPKAQPAKLRLLNGRREGQDSGGRKVPDPPAFVRYAPAKPIELSQEASDHWDQVVPELARLDLLTPGHLGGLVSLCECWAQFLAARDEGNLRDLIVASREYRAWAGEFGLTPSSETRLGVKEPKGDGANPFAPRSQTQS